MSNREVKNERTNWRDPQLEKIHNDYGLPLPLNGLGFLCLEYNFGKPVAIVNYEKWEKPTTQEEKNSSIVLGQICENHKLPFFEARYLYNPETDLIEKIKVSPLNKPAREKLAEINDYVIFTEAEYIYFLYSIRKYYDQGVYISAKLKENDFKVGLAGKELTWEHEVISLRHRAWGWNVPVIDLDFICINYSYPILMIEYKENNSFFNLEKEKNTTNIKALTELSNLFQVPFYIVRYQIFEDNITFLQIEAVNNKANEIIKKPLRNLNANNYFAFINSHKARKICPVCGKALKIVQKKPELNDFDLYYYCDTCRKPQKLI